MQWKCSGSVQWNIFYTFNLDCVCNQSMSLDKGPKSNVHKTPKWRQKSHRDVLCTLGIGCVSTEIVLLWTSELRHASTILCFVVFLYLYVDPGKRKKNTYQSPTHCVKSVQIRTRKYCVFGHFSHNDKHLQTVTEHFWATISNS